MKIKPGEDAPLCEIVYEIKVRKDDGSIYDSERFIAKIVPK